MEHSSENFESFDLGCCAACVALGFELKELKREEGQKKVKFVFLNNDRIKKVVDQYWNGNLQVNASEYFSAIKNIKNRLYSNAY